MKTDATNASLSVYFVAYGAIFFLNFSILNLTHCWPKCFEKQITNKSNFTALSITFVFLDNISKVHYVCT